MTTKGADVSRSLKVTFASPGREPVTRRFDVFDSTTISVAEMGRHEAPVVAAFGLEGVTRLELVEGVDDVDEEA
jgi:hypothetical protein